VKFVVQLTITLNPDLRLFHFLEKLGIAYDSGSVSNFTTCLVQPSDASNNGSFSHVRQFSDLLKRLPS
jgi:hypothetical protein